MNNEQKTPMENSIPEHTAKNDVPRCTLTDAELLEKCHDWITKLIATGGRAWHLHIPARLNDDPDLLFGELTWRFKKMLRAGSKTTKNDDTAADFTCTEITALIAKVHDDIEGRYELSGEDLFNIHAALCKLQ
jgi:hypothetical protein